MRFFCLIILVFSIEFARTQDLIRPEMIQAMSPEEIEQLIAISYNLENQEQISLILDNTRLYISSHPETNLLPLYRQRMHFEAIKGQLSQCVDPAACDFASRVLNDTMMVTPCCSAGFDDPILDKNFESFLQDFTAHIEAQEGSSTLAAQREFLSTGVVAAAENLAEMEYMTNPSATVDTVFDLVCKEANTSSFVNFFTGATKFTNCNDRIDAEEIRRRISDKFELLRGQGARRFDLASSAVREELSGQLQEILNEINQQLLKVTAYVRPVTDSFGRSVNFMSMQSFGPQMELALCEGAEEEYKKLIELIYQKTSSGIGMLLLSANIIEAMPSIEINNFGFGATSSFHETNELDPWGQHLWKFTPFEMKAIAPNKIDDLASDIKNTIRESAQELKQLSAKDGVLDPKVIGQYASVNPLNLARVLMNNPEMTAQICEFINYSQQYVDNRQEVDARILKASRWLGIGGAALTIIAGPLGVIPACIVGAVAGTASVAASGHLLYRKAQEYNDLVGAYASGGGDVLTVQEIMDSYEELSAQVKETLIAAGFTIIDYVMLGRAIAPLLRSGTKVADVVESGTRLLGRATTVDDLDDYARVLSKYNIDPPRWADDISLNPSFRGHLSQMDNFTQSAGVGGCHNLDNFNSVVSDRHLKVVTMTEHPRIKGLYQVEYQIPTVDRAGNVMDSFKSKVFTKTLYDPSVISDTDMLYLGQLAANSGYQEAIETGARIFDASAGGIDFRIYIKNGAIDNIHPTLPGGP